MVKINMSVGLQRRVPALDDAAGVPAAWKSGNPEPPFSSFAPPAGSPAGPAFAASPAPSTPGPGFTGPPYAAPGPFGSPSARPGSGGGFPPAPRPSRATSPGRGSRRPGPRFTRTPRIHQCRRIHI
ncbi:hypothetical protein MSG28_014584 [Choristoneura fumiferana]|uniref:Uncharacterized protein n=1 Tax=Choristoneura fumiferana TaxID=7141 RepID=A0ACC0JS57_CHOFU|nr:hypothetical protein MSG28_014584 [Choristoneura fumiferana]